jgi:hypothetical protein
MSKLSVILPAALILPLLTVGGCATKDDVAALRSDITALRATEAAAGRDTAALRSDIAALRAAVEASGKAQATGPDVKAIRSDIAALRTAIGSGDAARARSTTAAGAVTTKGPPPAGYRKVSTLVKLPEFIPGLGALYVQPQTLPAGPFLAYDRDDRLVSTIYMIPVSDITAQKRFEHLAAGATAVQDTDIYYNPGHPGVDVPHYHIVLWHVPQESAKLQ